jgi:hypothetical protein
MSGAFWNRPHARRTSVLCPRNVECCVQPMRGCNAKSGVMHEPNVELVIRLHIKVANDLTVKPRSRAGHDRRAHQASLKGVRQKRILADPSIWAKHALHQTFIWVEQ